MRVEDVETVLMTVLSKDLSEADRVVETERLEQCFGVLRRETAFKQVPPGEPIPLLSYDLVLARGSIESAIRALAAGDLSAALERSRSALNDVQRALGRKL